MEDLQEKSSQCSSVPSPTSPMSPSIPDPRSIDSEIWQMGEEKAHEILSAIRPVDLSNDKRKEVISFLEKQLGDSYGIEVHAYGSVPLGTYLPDGDIDLTAVSDQNEEELVNNVLKMLEVEDNVSGFLIKDVQYVPAKVQIVKCTINGIAVDISFNQVTGPNALRFKEKVNEIIGNNLYKNSILLIKAWCFYESRTLGSHNGWLSTYAVEMLTLYIINLSHSSLFGGPLEVLYRFMGYYSGFDWKNYCVSFNGPVSISYLPEVKVNQENHRQELLLTQEIITECKELFSAPKKTPDGFQELLINSMNIIDPLDSCNNIGKNISQGNLSRIKSAFHDGARRLGKILTSPEEDLGEQLKIFFVNTLDRCGSHQRLDTLDTSDPSGDYKSCLENLRSTRSPKISKPLCTDLSSASPPPESSLTSAPSEPCSASTPSNPSRISTPCNLSSLLPSKRSPLSRPGDNVFHRAQANQNPRGRGDVSSPNLTLQHPPAVTFDVSGGKSRGTGPYIPNMGSALSKEKGNSGFSPKRQNLEFSTAGRKPDPFTTSRSTKSSNVSFPKFTLEEFPLLPARGKSLSPSENHTEQLTAEPPLASKSSLAIGRIDFETGGNSKILPEQPLECSFLPKLERLSVNDDERVDVEDSAPTENGI